MYDMNETLETHLKENVAKIYLLDQMIYKKFKYRGYPMIHVVYMNYINNHQEILGRLLYDAFSQYFNSELTMELTSMVVNMIRMAKFTPETYECLEEFYTLFLLE
jgi:hypothetical protein